MEGEAPGEKGGTGRRADLVSVEAVDLEAGFGEAVDGRSGDLGVVVADAVPAEAAQETSARRRGHGRAQLERGRGAPAGGSTAGVGPLLGAAGGQGSWAGAQLKRGTLLGRAGLAGGRQGTGKDNIFPPPWAPGYGYLSKNTNA